jgi:phosphoserine phosphatase RsbU/P
MTKIREKSITIGLVSDELLFDIPIQFFRAVKDVTKKHNLHFLQFTSKPIEIPFSYSIQANILLNLISEQTVDGLIIASNLIAAYTSHEKLVNLFHKYHSLPVISLGSKVKGVPSIMNDNFKGMYEAVSHLIEVHGLTRIAFVMGIEEHPDVQERYKAYAAALKDHNIKLDPELVLPGNFQISSGHKAISLLIDERKQKPGRDFHAVVASNDYMASGVLRELETRSIKIPEDVAIVGFDNIFSSKYYNPPLSTVHQFFYKMGRKAAELIIARINGEEIPETNIVPSQFIPRRSCGCTDPHIKEPPQNVGLPAKIATAITENPREFLQYLSQVICDTGVTREELTAWDQVYTLLCKPGKWNWGVHDEKGEAFGHHAWSAVGKASYFTFNNTYNSRLIFDAGKALISTLDIPELMNILTRELPKFGIKTCYLVLYENPPPYILPQELPEYSKLILAYNENERIQLPPEGIIYPTQELLPKNYLRKKQRNKMLIEALYFQEEQIGFWILDANVINEKLSSMLTYQICSSLKSVLLLKQFQERTEELAAANKEIQILNRKLKDENIQIKTEMVVARHIQHALLPEVIKTIHPDFEITARMFTAAEVGGDYYDISLDKEGTLWLGIGDVSGHGVTSGLIMMMAQTVHTTITANYKASPRDIVIMVNNVLFKNITGRMEKTNFMTFTTLKYLGKGRFQYAGLHLDLIIYRHTTGACEVIETTGLWLNVNPDIRKKTKNTELFLDIGDVLVLYTDGLTEVHNKENKLLDMPRFIDIIASHGKKSVEEMEEAIFIDVTAWSNGDIKDDMSLVLVKRIR